MLKQEELLKFFGDQNISNDEIYLYHVKVKVDVYVLFNLNHVYTHKKPVIAYVINLLFKYMLLILSTLYLPN